MWFLNSLVIPGLSGVAVGWYLFYGLVFKPISPKKEEAPATPEELARLEQELHTPVAVDADKEELLALEKTFLKKT